MRPALFLALTWWASGPTQAHGFQERYDLPVPLSYVVAGAVAAVLLTFVAAVLFARRPTQTPLAREREPESDAPTQRPSRVVAFTRGFSFLLLALTIASALWGSRDPLMNLAPTMIWIVWWVGLSFATALLGNFWPALDPWRASFDLLDAWVRKLGRPGGLSLGWTWPSRLGVWPAVLLLLAWCWLEVVYPLASSPFKLGCAALSWSVFNWAGMACFGRRQWQEHADVFALYFSTLGRMAPIGFSADKQAVSSPAPGPRRDRVSFRPAAGQVGFVMATLSTVIFDGLHGGSAWNLFEGTLRKLAPQWVDVNGYFTSTLGLVLVWLVFLSAYVTICHASLALMRPAIGADERAPYTTRLAFAMVPIAAAYNVAHNFSSLVIQGQTIVQLLSDPFGRQWDLFGTARAYPNIGLVDARLTWHVAVLAIVLGHAVSIWSSHRVALSAGLSARRTALATLPLTLLMLAYTAVSLTLITEPMVAEGTATRP